MNFRYIDEEVWNKTENCNALWTITFQLFLYFINSELIYLIFYINTTKNLPILNLILLFDNDNINIEIFFQEDI